jgi:CheY-like chemotaxis protein
MASGMPPAVAFRRCARHGSAEIELPPGLGRSAGRLRDRVGRHMTAVGQRAGHLHRHGITPDVLDQAQRQAACRLVSRTLVVLSHVAIVCVGDLAHDRSVNNGATVETSILVVDDNEALADSIAELLRVRGYAVRVARDGIEALSILESFTPDCVLLDLAMPRMSGTELAHAIRERHGTRIVLVAVSGRSDLTVASADLELVDHWLTKPVDLDALYTIFPDLSSQD